MKILLLSDTHSYLDERIAEYCTTADEVWHCGDFGVGVAERLREFRPLRGVYGNIDGAEIRTTYPEVLRFRCQEVEVLMIHIGGYPHRYSPLAKTEISTAPPRLFISGHSHILKAMHDDRYNLLHLNPGAAGKTGWHKVRTMMRFEINGGAIENLEIIEIGKR